ncbi:Imm52 family immunity protein [Stenotrophomonas sp.]|jgi:hypothetical protein|uniref:Imm52 family immunity protein n=1 Tax=Stenotrophomonas sp. TaxID=69392 RepID=UPI0028B1E71B|nr:Imm52 family immunity protein [Stenotrophomonas sp.]
MKATVRCKMRSEDLDAEYLYGRAEDVLNRLSSIHGVFGKWWSVPTHAGSSLIAFEDRESVIKLIEQQRQDFQAKYPGISLSASNGILLANAADEEGWATKGSVSIAINPGPGEIRLDIGNLDAAHATPAELVWSSLKALAEDAQITLAQTNIMQTVGRERRLYSLHCSVLPHRDFLGWMGYVDQPVDESQVPDASRVERHGRGTMIMAAEDADLFNARSVEQMNRVEISLAELGLLPVISPSL